MNDRPANDRPAGIVLDLDGVLVDSVGIQLRTWEIAAAALGHVLPEDFEPATRALRTDERARWVAERAPVDVDDLLAHRGRALRRLLPDIQPFPETREALALLMSSGVPVAVGTSGSRARVRACLEPLGLGAIPLVCGDDVEAGKPAPDIFLRCADLLGVRPGDAAAVEDSPQGIDAARGAGMAVVGVQRTPHPRLHADVVVDDLVAAVRCLVMPHDDEGP